ncbi:hypothetical protein DPMN_087164, partial [Dreissena polymorpha]
SHPTTWRPEYAAYMVEGTPGKPYGGLMAHFNLVEANMRLRRTEIKKCLAEDEFPLALTCFPRLGCPGFSSPDTTPTPEAGASRSLFFADEVIFQGHPRFRTLTRNIRQRRGKKVAINIPVFKDKYTPDPFVEDLTQYGDTGEGATGSKPDHIYMDCMGFDHIYMGSMGFASPVYRGYLSDNDTRWTVIAQSVDDRTEEEMGLKPLEKDRFVINKSRYDSVDSYLSSSAYSDIELVYDKDLYKDLINGGKFRIDDLLAKHVAHLFIRDPVSLFSEKVNQNDEVDTDHFENIQSTNWQTMRFKPPPPDSNIGWRVEFRPMEVQLTDFENAAFTTFMVLMTRVILTFGLKFIIPLTKVDENLKRSFKRDAVLEQKFYFRKDILTDCSPPEAEDAVIQCCDGGKKCNIQDQYTQLSINDIIHGKEDFPGLLPLIENYMDMVEIDVDTRCTIKQYLNLISCRAKDFVQSHPDYKQDSLVSESINYDLLLKCAQISEGTQSDDTLLPSTVDTKTSDEIPSAILKEQKLMCNNCP